MAEFGPLVADVLSLGTGGLLFVMWWYERAERIRTGQRQERLRTEADQCLALTREVLAIVQANTAALTALRSELRARRGL